MGDVYALMVEYWFEKGQMENAYSLVEEMRSRNIVLTPYIDRIMLEAVLKVSTEVLVSFTSPLPICHTHGTTINCEEC